MKYVVYVSGLFATVVLSVLLCLSMSMKEMKRQQLETGISQAMRTALTQSMEAGSNRQECIRTFLEELDLELENKGNLAVEILQADIEKGILSARVRLTFTYPNGKTKELASIRTLIYDGIRSD